MQEKNKPVYLCAQCAKQYREPLKLREAPKQSAKRGECLFCGRKCYGTAYLEPAGKEAAHA